MNPGDRLADDVIRMEGAKTWSELEAICLVTDRHYEALAADDITRRAYENIRTRHAKRVAPSYAAA